MLAKALWSIRLLLVHGLDTMVWTQWSGHYGLDAMVWTLWSGHYGYTCKAKMDNFGTLFFFSLSQIYFYSSDLETLQESKNRHKLTLEHGADLLPGSHPTLAGVLAYGQPQEEQGHTTEEEGQTIRDEEGTCKWQQLIRFRWILLI